jgi:hypothetical protein
MTQRKGRKCTCGGGGPPSNHFFKLKDNRRLKERSPGGNLRKGQIKENCRGFSILSAAVCFYFKKKSFPLRKKVFSPHLIANFLFFLFGKLGEIKCGEKDETNRSRRRETSQSQLWIVNQTLASPPAGPSGVSRSPGGDLSLSFSSFVDWSFSSLPFPSFEEEKTNEEKKGR